MSEQIPGRIIIMGKLATPEAVLALAEAILEDGAGQDDDNHYDEELVVMDDMAEAVAKGELFGVMDSYACNGEFPEIMRVCREHGLAFRLHSGGSRNLIPQVTVYDPRMGGELEALADQDDTDILVPLGDIENALRGGLPDLKSLIENRRVANGRDLPKCLTERPGVIEEAAKMTAAKM